MCRGASSKAVSYTHLDVYKRQCYEIAATKGIEMVPSEQDPVLRMESVRKPLRTLIGGEPQFILHPRCLTIRKGFLGGYNLRRIQVAGPERYASRPDKQGYSHIMNAMEYTAATLFAPALTRGPPSLSLIHIYHYCGPKSPSQCGLCSAWEGHRRVRQRVWRLPHPRPVSYTHLPMKTIEHAE